MKNIDEELTKLLTEVASNGKAVDISYYIPLIKQLFEPEGMLPLEERKEAFKTSCRTLLKEDRSNAKMLGDFFTYWSESGTKSNSKMRWEKQPTFSLPLRYAKWEKQAVKFSIVNQLKSNGK